MTAQEKPKGTGLLWQLEAVRGAAACYVAAGHLWRPSLDAIHDGLGAFLGFGQEVVITFFLLSGFVIHWSVSQKPDLEFRKYFRDRALRIYPLYIFTLLIALGAAHFHASTDPRTSWTTFAGNLFMLQDWGAIKPGVWVEVYAGVLVLWSLSYEWWFYMLYFPISKVRSAQKQLGIVAGISLSQALVYFWMPNQASRFLMYFCIWWTGVELARAKLANKQLNLANLKWPLITLLAVAVILGWSIWRYVQSGAPLLLGAHPCLEFRHFLAAIGILIGALLWHEWQWIGFRSLLGMFIKVAPWSYALYLLHEPLTEHLFNLSAIANPWMRMLTGSVIAVFAAWAAEKYIQTACRKIFRK